jgi:hypothetical protein
VAIGAVVGAGVGVGEGLPQESTATARSVAAASNKGNLRIVINRASGGWGCQPSSFIASRITLPNLNAALNRPSF